MTQASGRSRTLNKITTNSGLKSLNIEKETCRTKNDVSLQGRRKRLRLGGARHFEGTFFFRKRGHFLKIKMGTSLFIAKSWGARAPSAPGSYVYVSLELQIKKPPTFQAVTFLCTNRIDPLKLGEL